MNYIRMDKLNQFSCTPALLVLSILECFGIFIKSMMRSMPTPENIPRIAGPNEQDITTKSQNLTLSNALTFRSASVAATLMMGSVRGWVSMMVTVHSPREKRGAARLRSTSMVATAVREQGGMPPSDTITRNWGEGKCVLYEYD